MMAYQTTNSMNETDQQWRKRMDSRRWSVIRAMFRHITGNDLMFENRSIRPYIIARELYERFEEM